MRETGIIAPTAGNRRMTAPAPWFVPPPLPSPRGRLLLATYHFPPSPAVGGLRWQKLAAVAAERGWEVDVLALDPAALDRRDDARLGDLPSGVRIYAVPKQMAFAERLEEWLV